MIPPRYAESVPSLTAPVKLPKLIPRRALELAAAIVGVMLLVIDVALVAIAVVVL